MSNYLNYQFNDTREFISTYDELPLWSAPFGMLLLKHVKMQAGMTVLDVGSGTGFPLLELAQRLGKSCRCYGLDIWKNANERALQKTKNYDVSNVEILEASAENIPFDANSVDLIVSNLGINNFENAGQVLKECHRVLRPAGWFAFTSNLNRHWDEFYKIFAAILQDTSQNDLLEKLNEHIGHRGTVASVTSLFENAGFKVKKCVQENFEMRFLDGSAFLNHYFIKMGFLGSWKNMIPGNVQTDFFKSLEEKLNEYAVENGELKLSVPMLYIEGEK